jgi:hypothetical protein
MTEVTWGERVLEERRLSIRMYGEHYVPPNPAMLRPDQSQPFAFGRNVISGRSYGVTAPELRSSHGSVMPSCIAGTTMACNVHACECRRWIYGVERLESEDKLHWSYGEDETPRSDACTNLVLYSVLYISSGVRPSTSSRLSRELPAPSLHPAMPVPTVPSSGLPEPLIHEIQAEATSLTEELHELQLALHK